MSGPDAISGKFTGKERDSETGFDYFGARYMSSAQGRWTSPDRMNITDDKLLVPSTLNKYVYAANNPVHFIDLDGLDVVALLEPPHGIMPGHFMLFANNSETGKSAMMSFGPADTSLLGHLATDLGFSVASTNAYALPNTADELRNGYAALSIQTTPEQAQEVLDYIKKLSASTGSTPYAVLSTNCTTVCRDAVKAIGLLPRNAGSIAPASLWSILYQRYGNQSLLTHPEIPARYGETRPGPGQIPSQQGFDFGNSRFGMNTFDYIMLMLQPTQVTSTICYQTADGKQSCQ
jgi:RHS repeat-associated core domain